ISWSSYYLEDFELYFQQLTLVNLNDDINQSEDEQKKLDEQKTKLTLLQTKLKQVKISTENAKLSYDDACNAEYIVRQKREEYLRQCIEREEKIENETKLQQHCVDDLEDNLKLLNEKYKIKLKNEQYQWCKNVIQCFQRISNEICKFIFNLVDKQPSTSTENYQNLLLILISLVRQDFLEPTKMKLDLNKIINIEQIVKEQLDQIFIYTKFLTEKDPMHNYLRFYREIFYIGFCSLKNSLKSWKIYSEKLQSIEIESFIQKNKKQDLCQLNTLTREKCFKFIEQIRTGYEQTEIMKSAQDISRYVRNKTNNFDFIFTGQQFGKQIKNLIRDFERFITNLLIIGCRYLQLQRGTREPLDDLLIGITYEVIDRHLPRNELVLLQLLDTCEIQLKSHCDTLLFQTLHITFQFSSNPFALSDRLDRSAKALSHLILPAAHMIERMWSTITQLINKIGAKITEEEYKILDIVCKDFVRLIEPSCEIINESDFLHLQLKSNQFQLMSEHIDNLYEILIDKRHGMKIFCENMKSRW
ncbi:unnamed protein product, partial [Rotaria sp. Silwood2]